ncbi:MAG: hypothetical protein NTW61_08005 [Candidatus Melainabacteria bacterium]|nr:hypothetical protein [Candidatus Melainabacteria bacterium]
MKKPEFLMLPHDHGWEYVSFTKFGSIIHSIWSLTKQKTEDTYKKYVLVYTNKNQTEKAGMLNFLSTVYLKLLRAREVSQGQSISMTKGALHSVKAKDGTVTVLLNYGHPDNLSHFLYPPKITPSRDPSNETSFSFQKLPQVEAISGMLSFIIDRLGQEPPSCPINPLNEIECAENL